MVQKINAELDFMEPHEIESVILQNNFDEDKINEYFKKFAVDEKYKGLEAYEWKQKEQKTFVNKKKRGGRGAPRGRRQEADRVKENIAEETHSRGGYQQESYRGYGGYGRGRGYWRGRGRGRGFRGGYVQNYYDPYYEEEPYYEEMFDQQINQVYDQEQDYYGYYEHEGQHRNSKYNGKEQNFEIAKNEQESKQEKQGDEEKKSKTKKPKKKKEPIIPEPEPIKLSKKKRQFFISPLQKEIEPDSDPEKEVVPEQPEEQKEEVIEDSNKEETAIENYDNDEEEDPEDDYAKYEEEYNKEKHLYDVHDEITKKATENIQKESVPPIDNNLSTQSQSTFQATSVPQYLPQSQMPMQSQQQFIQPMMGSMPFMMPMMANSGGMQVVYYPMQHPNDGSEKAGQIVYVPMYSYPQEGTSMQPPNNQEKRGN